MNKNNHHLAVYHATNLISKFPAFTRDKKMSPVYTTVPQYLVGTTVELNLQLNQHKICSNPLKQCSNLNSLKYIPKSYVGLA